MRRIQPEKFTLPLRDLYDLFSAPSVDPSATDFSEDYLCEPGIDHLFSHLRGRRLPKRGQLLLVVRPGVVQRDLACKARRAIDRYCRHKILESKRTLNELLWIGLKALQVGVLFLIICLVLAAAIAGSNVAPGSFGDVLTQGLTIVGWVSLWRPVEILLYEWWPLWREVRVYDYIQRMDVAIQAKS
jgi:hypothetical protein